MFRKDPLLLYDPYNIGIKVAAFLCYPRQKDEAYFTDVPETNSGLPPAIVDWGSPVMLITYNSIR